MWLVSVSICPPTAFAPSAEQRPFMVPTRQTQNKNAWSPWIPLCANSSTTSDSFVHLILCLQMDGSYPVLVLQRTRSFVTFVITYIKSVTRSASPHQFRHTYATEMLRAGMSLTAVMKLLGTLSEMTMQYLDVTLNDLKQAFELARSKPRHLVPQPRVLSAPLREGLDGVIDSFATAQHVLEMFRCSLLNDTVRIRLNRLSNRLTKILIKTRNLATP